MHENLDKQPGTRIDQTVPLSMQPHNEDYFLNQNNLDVLLEERRTILQTLAELEGRTDQEARTMKAKLEDRIVRVGRDIAEFASHTPH